MSGIKKLTLSNMGDIQKGSLSRVVDAEIEKIYNDMDERDACKQPRELTIKLVFKPDESMSDAESAIVSAHVNTKLPNKEISTRVGINRRDNGFTFSSASASNPAQQGLPME